jgi:hypothetical protein
VHTKPEPSSPMTIRYNPPPSSWMDRLARGLVLRKLAGFKRGSLAIKLPEGRVVTVGGQEPGPNAFIELREMAFFRRLLMRGAIGLGESYVDELWRTDDLFKVFSFFLCNETRLTKRERPNHPANMIVKGSSPEATPGRRPTPVRAARPIFRRTTISPIRSFPCSWIPV